ncbi:hypothetical protein RUM43_000783 [Polyplax serrata]|uniref:Filamin n=1 Tax=Polyplax serrata TaxID=468196 RepID=A0AAN8XR00_POLSC
MSVIRLDSGEQNNCSSPWRVNVSSSGKAMTVLGETVKLVPAGSTAAFHISAQGKNKSDIDVQVTSPSKRPIISRVYEEKPSEFRLEFTPTEVGSHVVDVTIGGTKLIGGPLIAKVYNSSQIRVTDVGSGIVGLPCQFKVDASQAGEGQLEISINEGQVPNHVQVVGGGRCLISFTPEQPKPHYINIKFNGETVMGCPFVCSVSESNRVTLSLRNLELIPVNQVARFHMTVDDNNNAELAVSVRGPSGELPVKVSGNIDSGFVAEFTPRDVGAHTLTVEYNGQPVGGTPFVSKAYDSKQVYVGPLPKGQVGKTLEFLVDASQAGEGNLEITISARGHNIPTQVHPQGNARFSVSFLPIEASDHVVNIHFNKESVPGSPFVAGVQGDSPHNVMVSGSSLSAAPVGKTSYFTLSNVAGGVEDIEVNVEGPNGQSVPAQMKENGGGTHSVEFTPRVVGEHKIMVNYRGVAVAGSPFGCKVYDCKAIKVKNVEKGVVGKPVTFLDDKSGIRTIVFISLVVETSQAGPGNLEVTVNGGRVPTAAQAQGSHIYAISFTPREADLHTVDLKFNSEHLPGSPFTCEVTDAAKIVMPSDGMEKVAVGRLASFVIEADSNLGPLDIQVLSPTRKNIPVDISNLSNNKHEASFTPEDVGDHSVEVKINDNHIEGSPFLLKAYDASRVKVADINSGVVGKPVFFSINASQAGAGNLEIIVSVNGRNVPNYVQSEGNAKFRVNFKPQEAAPHNLSVRFNGEPVPGSPFLCKIMGSNQIIVTGPALKMTPIGQTSCLFIGPQSTGTQCQVSIQSPSGKMLPVNLTKADGKYTANFTPNEVGRHNIDVILDKNLVKGSPFPCNVYDVSRVKISGLGPTKVGKPATFRVDACEAGEGTLELVVSTDRSTVKAEVVACARGLYDVTFVPHEAVTHYVNISFNEEDVPGSPFKCDILETGNKERTGMKREDNSISIKGEGPKEIVVGQKTYYDVEVFGASGHVDMEVLDDVGSSVPCRVQRINSSKHRATFIPMTSGTYQITVFHNEQPINKQPFAIEVFNPSAVHILDLEPGFTNRATSFKVDSREAGPGALAVTVRAAGNPVKHTLKSLSKGLHEVTFYPTISVPHKIDVKYNGLHIRGCPLQLPIKNPAVGQDVMATGLGLYEAKAGKSTSFVIETLGNSSSDFDVVITGPNSSAVPVRCYQQKDGNLMAEFTAQNAGLYKIEVSHGSRAVRGSPYMCQVHDSSKVKIHDAKKPVTLNVPATLKLSRKGAGFAELDVAVTSPLGQDLPIQVKSGPDRESDLIEFTPTLPGNYKFKITYGGDEIPGSPLLLTCEDTEPIKAHGDGIHFGQVDGPVSFRVNADSKPTIRIDGPDTSPSAKIETERPGVYLVTYVPRETGVFDIQVIVGDREILGSPFHPRIVDTRKVRAIGGWESLCDSTGQLELTMHHTKKISLDVSEAGPAQKPDLVDKPNITGTLSADFRGPDGESVPTAVETISSSKVRVLLTPRDPGEHTLNLSFGGVPVPGTPLQGCADGSNGGGPVRVVLTGRGLTAAKCHQEAEFTIDGSQAGPGVPEVSLSSNKGDIKVNIENVGNNIYRGSYVPTTPGVFLLNVMWADRQVKGCPLKVSVNASADASQVACSGDGLRVGTVGKEIRSFIDTRRAGPGELTAHCAGPYKVAYCELYDHGDGTFTLNVKPQESGRHILTVKYGGEHVPGSPYTLRVAGAPDPSKVRVYGPGVEHGVLATFQSRFICDTRGAGAGQLTVRVRGPKGAFRVEMQRESQKDRTILCKFHPTEPGDYRVEVKWAGELVPGSPFNVMIFDTQEELNRFIQGQQSPGSDVYGSVSYGHVPGSIGRQPSWRGSQPTL